ncbi:MAG: hypothetical protein V4547_16175 [Bacteroidota bacterium]
MQKTLAELQAIWVTGYTPTQADYSNLFESYENLKDDNLLIGYAQINSGFFPPDPIDAIPLTKKFTFINGSDGIASGLKLPPALKGRQFYFYSTQADGNTFYCDGTDVLVSTGNPTSFVTNKSVYVQGTCATHGGWIIAVTTADQLLSSPKIYKATLTQSGTDAPVATELVNTLGNIVWTRDSIGYYIGTLIGAFPNPIKIGVNCALGQSAGSKIAYVNDADTINLQVLTPLGAYADDLLVNNLLDIEIYP